MNAEKRRRKARAARAVDVELSSVLMNGNTLGGGSGDAGDDARSSISSMFDEVCL